jgi:hypothetical protein
MHFFSLPVAPQTLECVGDSRTAAVVLGEFGMGILLEQKIDAIAFLIYHQHLKVIAWLTLHYTPIHQVAVYVFDLSVKSAACRFENIA